MEKRELATEIINNSEVIKAAIKDGIESHCKGFINVYNMLIDSYKKLGMEKAAKEIEIKKSVIQQQLDTSDDDAEIMYLIILNTLWGTNE